MSDIELTNSIPENLFSGENGKELTIAFLLSPMHLVEGLNITNPEPNTNNPMVKGTFLNSDKLPLYSIVYTIGNETSLGDDALQGYISTINEALFGEKTERYIDFSKSPKECAENYLNGIIDFHNFNVNKYKEKIAPTIIDKLEAYAQHLTRLNKSAVANKITEFLIPVVKEVINGLGKEKVVKDKAPASETAEIAAENVENVEAAPEEVSAKGTTSVS